MRSTQGLMGVPRRRKFLPLPWSWAATVRMPDDDYMLYATVEMRDAWRRGVVRPYGRAPV